MSDLASPEGLSPRQRISIDIGGTFTDVYGHDPGGTWTTLAKVPTTPDDPVRGVLAGIQMAGVDLAAVDLIVHGTTVATNALVTRDLPRAAMVTTEGFRDVIEIGDGTKENLWDLYRDNAAPYILRRDRYTVLERIDSSGRVLEPLDERGLTDVVQDLLTGDYKAVAVCFINSYANPKHEERAAAVIRDAMPDAFVMTSTQVRHEIGEWERFSTTAVNAVLAPVVADYLQRMSATLSNSGYRRDLAILHSGGGVITSREAAVQAARLAGSGLVAAAVAAKSLASRSGYSHAIGLDIGGTSADISLIIDGKLRTTDTWSVDYGHPICFPSVDVATVGAGGGSIAWIDEGGSLRSGPRSAGAYPGPACYGFGGADPTNTDAHLVLGHLSGTLAANSRILNRQLAEAAVLKGVAEPLGVGLEEAARAILTMSAANMANGIRLMTSRNGIDQQESVLIAFGGAGPMFAAALARELAIGMVLIPPHPGLTSALGGLQVDIRHDYSETYFAVAQAADAEDVERRFAAMEEEAYDQLRADGLERNRTGVVRTISMRYLGQWRSLDIPVDAPISSLHEPVLEFHRAHERDFSYELDASVEIYRLGLTAYGYEPKYAPQRVPLTSGHASPVSERPVLFLGESDWVPCPVYRRSDLKPGYDLAGPAIVEELDSTTLLPPKATGAVDEWGNLRVRCAR
jgi:N-methylhydantoinase A